MTAKLTLTIGLPGSGKSTWAEAQRAARPSCVRIVCRDDIRAYVGTRYDDGDEPLVERIRDFMIDSLLREGYEVICSDTNLSPKVQRRLTQLADARDAETVIQDFRHVPLDVCLKRNEHRWLNGDRKVPNSVIRRMHEMFIEPLAEAAQQGVE